jgi:flagellar motor switch protein FliG
MTNIDPNLRKAAVLLRSLDADTATMMLGQLTAEEASAIRAAMRVVGQVESSEQADVAAELRRERPVKAPSSRPDVELELSSSFAGGSFEYAEKQLPAEVIGLPAKRFEFLESAPIHALVPHLAREHAQTIAVVLSHLDPQRAAAILAALPHKVQAETVERLSALGETDPECVSVVEREMAGWAAKRDGSRASDRGRRDTMSAILAAADTKSRGQILSSMRDHKAAVANQFAPRRAEAPVVVKTTVARSQYTVLRERMAEQPKQELVAVSMSPPPVQLPRLDFDDLIRLDSRALSAVLRQVDADVLALALAGSRDDLVDRICEQMPKRTARDFRRQLRRLGPTRLSDVETAQQAVAKIAAQHIAERRQALAATHV